MQFSTISSLVSSSTASRFSVLSAFSSRPTMRGPGTQISGIPSFIVSSAESQSSSQSESSSATQLGGTASRSRSKVSRGISRLKWNEKDSVNDRINVVVIESSTGLIWEPILPPRDALSPVNRFGFARTMLTSILVGSEPMESVPWPGAHRNPGVVSSSPLMTTQSSVPAAQQPQEPAARACRCGSSEGSRAMRTVTCGQLRWRLHQDECWSSAAEEVEKALTRT